MKTAIIHNHPIHYKHLLFAELKRQGLDFDVVFSAGGSSIRHEPIPLSEHLYRCQVAWPGPYETAPLWRRVTFAWRSLSRLVPDVVIISSYNAAECWSAWFWALARRKPVVMWFESNDFDYERHWPKEFLKRLFCSCVSRAHVYGQSNKEYLIKLGIPESNIDVKRAVANVDQLARPGLRAYRLPTEPRTLLYVGRLAPEKNLGFLLRSFAAAALLHTGPPMNLLLVGSGPSEADLRKQASLLGISNRVKFLGYIPQANLPQIFESADFFVLPSAREPWGLVSLEAMLGRLPVLISTQCGCARDVVTPANGWTFSPHRNAELTTLLAALPTLPLDQVLAMGDASFTTAKEYTAANCAGVVIRSIALLFLDKSNPRPAPSTKSPVLEHQSAPPSFGSGEKSG